MRILINGVHRRTGDRTRMEFDNSDLESATLDAHRQNIDVVGISVRENGMWVARRPPALDFPSNTVRPPVVHPIAVVALLLILFGSPLLPVLGGGAAVLTALMLIVPDLRPRLCAFLGMKPKAPAGNTLKILAVMIYAGALAFGAWKGAAVWEAKRRSALAAAENHVQELRIRAVQQLHEGDVDAARATLQEALLVPKAWKRDGIKEVLAKIDRSTDRAFIASTLRSLSDEEYRSYVDDGEVPELLDLGYAALTESVVKLAEHEIPAVQAERAERARLVAEEEERIRQEKMAEERRRQREREVGHTLTAYTYMQMFVEQRLKSPGSADWPWSGPRSVVPLGNHRYKIDSYVDAQNAFGGVMRQHFEGVIKETEETWVLEYLKFK